MALICNGQLDILELEQKYSISFEHHFGEEMSPLRSMIHDGLLTLDQEVIEVLPRGKLLLRNICMVFDHYLGGTSGSVSFSRTI